MRQGGESPRIAVIVTSLPERAAMLQEALEGVAAQTCAPAFVVVGINHSPDRIDAATHANRLVDAVDEEWLAFLHDDDVWLPDHLEGLAAASDDADIVVADFVVEGRDWHPGHSCQYERLRSENWFGPSAVMIRSAAFRKAGGWPQKVGEIWGDWGMWRSLLDSGARFRCSHRTTVRYRFHGENMTFEAGAPTLPLGAGLERDGWPEGFSDDGWAGPRLSMALRPMRAVEALVLRGRRPDGSTPPTVTQVTIDSVPTPSTLRSDGDVFELDIPVKRQGGESFRLRVMTDADPVSMARRSAGDERQLSFQLIELIIGDHNPLVVKKR